MVEVECDTGDMVKDSESSGASGNRFPVIDKYTVEAVVGSGGFSQVYRATHNFTNDTHAIKVISSALGEKALEVFEREAQILVELKGQANIVRVTDAGRTENDDSLYLVMDYYETSFDRVESLDVEQVLEIGRKIAGALAVMHAQGIIHKDVKPSNIFADAKLEPALGDFGISTHGNIDPSRTIQAFSMNYAAPEVFLGGKAEAPRDVYALGATLYHFLEGDPPLGKQATPGEAQEAMALRIFEQEPDALTNPGVSSELATLVLRCLAKDPRDRPPADELAAELTELAASYRDRDGGSPVVAGELPMAPPDVASPRSEWVPASDGRPDPVPLAIEPSPFGGMAKDRTGFRAYQGIDNPPATGGPPSPDLDPERPELPEPDDAPARRLLPIGVALGALVLLIGIGLWRLPDAADESADEGSPLASPDGASDGDPPDGGSVEVLLPPEDVQVAATDDGGLELTWTSRLEPPEGFWVSLADSDIGESAASSPHTWSTEIPEGMSPCFEVFAVGELGMSFPSSPIRCAAP
ncbi:MAG: serine/threonine-protein kinase [Actinomycetota bacterium]